MEYKQPVMLGCFEAKPGSSEVSPGYLQRGPMGQFLFILTPSKGSHGDFRIKLWCGGNEILSGTLARPRGPIFPILQ